MKYLINNSFKAIRTGEFVQADESAGEFVLDTIEDGHTNACLLEVCKANKISVHAKATKAELITALEDGLSGLNLPEQNKMTDTQVVENVIEEGVANDRTDDEMLVAIVNEGISFKSAGRLFKQIMEEKGYRVSAAERAEEASKILADADFKPESYSDVAEMIAKITQSVNDTTDKQALVAIRKYAKENGIDMPKKSAGAGRASGGGLLEGIANWMLANRDADEAAIVNAIEELKPGISDKQTAKYKGHAVRMMAFAKKWAES